MSFVIVMSQCPDLDSAKQIAETLLAEKSAACVNILPKGQSMYSWQGQIEIAEEWMLLIKTHRDCYDRVESSIQQLHPYEVAEIIALPIEFGSADYLAWLDENCVK